jgi:hypothetical protein
MNRYGLRRAGAVVAGLKVLRVHRVLKVYRVQ